MGTKQFSRVDLEQILVRAAGLPAGSVPGGGGVTPADAGLDSLAFLQLQTEIADGYAVELPDDWHSTRTFDDIVTFVNSNTNSVGVASA